jgi:hypothetical protein
MYERGGHDRIRALRFQIKQDKQRLENAPLGPIQKSRLKRQIETQQTELKRLNKEKRERKKREVQESMEQNGET